jgi:hypothetical protein
MGATALRADVFSFSYSGVSALGNVTESATLMATATGILGSYTVTGILNGTRAVGGNSVNFNSSSLMAGSFTYGLPILSPLGSLKLSLAGLGTDTLSFSSLGGTESFGLLSLKNSAGSFTMSRASVPEAATLSLLLTMGLGVWVLARKMPAKKLL